MINTNSNLSKGEEIIAKAVISKMAIVPTIIFCTVLFFGFSFFMWVIDELSAAIVVSEIAVVSIIILCKVAVISNIELTLTNKKIFGTTGLINRIQMDSPIGKINNVTTKRGFGGQLFGYGTVVICTSSGTFNFNMIDHPDVFKQRVMEQIEIAEEERERRHAEQIANSMRNN